MPTGKNLQFELEEYIKQGKPDDLSWRDLQYSGKYYFGYHIDNFRELKEDEV